MVKTMLSRSREKGLRFKIEFFNGNYLNNPKKPFPEKVIEWKRGNWCKGGVSFLWKFIHSK